MRTAILGLAICLAANTLTAAVAAQKNEQTRYAVVDRIAGPASVTGWDYATVDAGARRLYLATAYSSGGGLTVLDLSTRQVSTTLQGHQSFHGVAVLHDGIAAAADATGNAVLFFDAASGKLLANVATGKPPRPDGWHNPDSLLLEPKSGLLVACNKDSGTLTLVDPARHAVVGSIPLGGELEGAAAKGDGTVYVNIESHPAIAVVDIPSRKVIRKLPLQQCEEPTGLQYDAADALVISVCGNGFAKFVDPDSGANVASIPVGKGADAVMFDGSRKIVFTAGGDDGTLSVIRVADRHNINLIQTLTTQPGVRLGAIDPATGKLYLPAARPDLKAPPLHLPGLPPIPPAAAGSFQFLVVAPQT